MNLMSFRMFSCVVTSSCLVSLFFVSLHVFAFIFGCQWLYNQFLLGRKFYLFWKFEMIIESER